MTSPHDLSSNDPQRSNRAVVGSVLGFIPLVLLVAPVIGGGVAGYLELDGAKRGAVSGGVAGFLIAALTTVITGTITFARFGDLPFASLDVPLEGLALAAALSLLASVGQVVIAGISGGLGDSRSRPTAG